MLQSASPSRGDPIVVHPDHLLHVATALLAAAGLREHDAALVADSLVYAEMRGRFGIGACAVRNSNHCGAMAYYTQMAAAQAMIGVAASNANPTVAPWGGKDPVLGTNPISVAVPTPGETPFLLDMSTSAAARGKIILAASAGERIPQGWALDRAGRPTQDPSDALQGVLLPAAGPKGYGLALLVDVMCGVLSGSAFGLRVGALYDEFTRPQRSGHFVKTSTPAEGFDEVLVPGEPEARAEARAKQEGIRLPASVHSELAALARRLGLECGI